MPATFSRWEVPVWMRGLNNRGNPEGMWETWEILPDGTGDWLDSHEVGQKGIQAHRRWDGQWSITAHTLNQNRQYSHGDPSYGPFPSKQTAIAFANKNRQKKGFFTGTLSAPRLSQEEVEREKSMAERIEGMVHKGYVHNYSLDSDLRGE